MEEGSIVYTVLTSYLTNCHQLRLVNMLPFYDTLFTDSSGKSMLIPRRVPKIHPWLIEIAKILSISCITVFLHLQLVYFEGIGNTEL